MGKVNILGCSRDTTAVVVELLYEVCKYNKFLIYKNLEIDIIPSFPLLAYDCEFFEPGIFPPSEAKVVFGVSGPYNKKEVLKYFSENKIKGHYLFDRIIHPTSYIAGSSVVESGVIVEPFVVISSQTKVDFGVFIKRGAMIGHHNHIGSFSDINPGAVISGKVTVGTGCVIGSGVVITDNVSIGDNTIIGVGSVVTNNIPSGVIAFGNPCKVVRENDKWSY